ncbi:LysR substrate-binding domain-containing protein [Rhodoferax ferrireducens]|uniref:LysR substrate-binding domain-containing protein n=1 Tax=Rhodoferax ferrireducens TaxID=192843 RepID=UPI000E0DE005|nr:LysR substrate-binding domain-containing protein [Rhodoferax ferrireducens]
MDLKQLENYVRVAELGSFTRAALELNVAQPALSRQVRLLEVELRQNLLVRNGRGAVPTEAGKVLLEHGRGILHQVQRARDDLGRLRGGLAGRVAVGLPPSVARVLAVPLTRALREAMPDARIAISEAMSGNLQEWLMSGRMDVVILYNAQASREVDLLPLFEQELLLVQLRQPGMHEDPPSGPVSMAELAQTPLVIPSRPNAIRMHVESALADAGCKPHVALEIEGVNAILDLVHDGAGGAILARNALLNTQRPSAYAARQIGNPPLRIALSLATSLQRPITSAQKIALELIQDIFPRVVGH